MMLNCLYPIWIMRQILKKKKIKFINYKKEADINHQFKNIIINMNQI